MTEELKKTLSLRQQKKDELVSRLMDGTEILSYSSLSTFGESPKSFIEYKLKERKQTEAMLYGTVLHCLILEPEEFKKRYFIVEDNKICAEIGGAKPRSTNKYKEWYNLQIQEAGEKIIIEPQMYIEALAASYSVHNNYPANNLLKKCDEAEKKIEWEYMNFKFRGVIDKMKSEKCVIDIKTCQDAHPRSFQRDIINRDYHLQGAMYLKGIGQTIPYYWIAVDKSGGVSVHLMDKKLLDVAFERYNFLMESLNSCILLDAWDKSFDFYSLRNDGIFVCDKPAYMY